MKAETYLPRRQSVTVPIEAIIATRARLVLIIWMMAERWRTTKTEWKIDRGTGTVDSPDYY